MKGRLGLGRESGEGDWPMFPPRKRTLVRRGESGSCRESGEDDWPRFPRFRTGAARPLAEVFASPETRGA